MTNQPIPKIPDFLDGSTMLELPARSTVFQAGQICDKFLYLVSGSVRVDLHSFRGKSVMLYQIGPGQSCVMTTSCLMGGSDYAAEATAETDIIACALSANQFEAQLHASSAFRAFVFDVFARRLGDMMMKIEQVAFSPLDQRLAKRIEQMRGPDPLLTITHEQLAADLGSSREVVSRRLAKWEDHGLIERGHRSVRIVNAAGIARLAQLGD